MARFGGEGLAEGKTKWMRQNKSHPCSSGNKENTPEDAKKRMHGRSGWTTEGFTSNIVAHNTKNASVFFSKSSSLPRPAKSTLFSVAADIKAQSSSERAMPTMPSGRLESDAGLIVAVEQAFVVLE